MANKKNNEMNKERMDGQGTTKNQDKEFNQGNEEKGRKSRHSQRNQG
jgi:hypothetical protein